MRSAVLAITNDNVRREFVFADVVEILSSRGMEITLEKVEPDRSQSINTVQELLQAMAAPFLRRGDGAGRRRRLTDQLGLTLSPSIPLDVFFASAATHNGHLYFFPWWEGTWLSKQ